MKLKLLSFHGILVSVSHNQIIITQQNTEKKQFFCLHTHHFVDSKFCCMKYKIWG